ncbi:hypothetical protein lerEdw1_010958 [Lerista edwardsae]|nr:hypothetical protein lerEdw1_010958 [Lerista edwardsae]
MGGKAGWFQCGFRFGAVEPVPVPLRASGPVVAVRPSWSFVGIVSAGVTLQGAVQGALPPDCRDALLSETHLLLLRRQGTVLEGWEVGSAPGLDGKPTWQRELPQEEAGTALPLVAGGYVFPKPPFFAPLPEGLQVQKLALGHEHAVLLDAGGALFTWGSGRHGQLGHGELESRSEPQRVEALDGLPMGEVAAGGWHSACISGTGDLYVWGWNEAGQLALPSKGGVQRGVGTAAAAAAGGAAELQGAGPGGHEESVVVSIQAFPALLDLPQEAEVRKVGCGSRHTAAVTRAGDLYTWGWGKYVRQIRPAGARRHRQQRSAEEGAFLHGKGPLCGGCGVWAMDYLHPCNPKPSRRKQQQQ